MIIYTAALNSRGHIDTNIVHARKYAILLWEAGHAVICPQLNSAHMEQDCKATYDDFMQGDFKIISRCDAVFMIPGWEQSCGAPRERDYAMQLGIPIFYGPDIPPAPDKVQR